LHKNTMQEIFDSNFFRDIEKTWTTCGLFDCFKKCGSFDKLNKQFERIEHE